MMVMTIVMMVMMMVMVETVMSSLPTAALSSCTGQAVTEWNTDLASIKSSLQSWLLDTLTQSGEYHGVVTRLYNPVNNIWATSWPGDSLEDETREVVTVSDNLEDEAREVITVSKFSQGKPAGLTWQWRSNRESAEL